MPIQDIALRHLEISPLNVRKTRSKQAIEQMAASIEAVGILQNFRVHTNESGMYGVVIGGTRLAALQLLLKQKKITEDFLVPCDVRPSNDPSLTEASLAENVVRDPMNPADEFEAFKKLADEGQGPETIAARFGVSPTVVKQRLKLAVVSKKLISAFRKDEMTLEMLMAFTISDDVKAQERVWKELPDWARERGDGEPIRAALTKEHTAADSKLAKFVGIEVYAAAGGHINRDLFQPEGAGWLTDTDLLNRIVGEKLSEAAEEVRAEGWKWVRQAPGFAFEETSKDGRLHPTHAAPTPEQQSKIDTAQAEADELMRTHGEEPADKNAYDRLFELQQQIDDLNEGAEVWTDEQKATAGAYVSIGHNGELSIVRGVVKPEDKAAARKLNGAADGAEADHPKPNGKDKGGLPAALLAELTSHKTVAAQLVMATNPNAALLAVTHALAIRMLYTYGTGEHSSLEINAHGPTMPLAIREAVAKSAPAKKLATIVKAMQKKLPKKPDELWSWLEKQTPTTIRQVLSVAASLTIDMTQVNGADAKPSAGALAKIIKLDMAEFWSATAENYLSRLPKKRLIAELGDTLKPNTRKQLESMKKDAAAKTILSELKGKRWLPPTLRVG